MNIRRARRLAIKLPHYLEVKYEDLVQNPEDVLRTVCSFIELPYDARMLAYHESAIDIFKEMGNWNFANWTASETDIRTIHQKISEPPDPARIDSWKEDLSDSEIDRFNDVASQTLKELGYQ